jgi:uncharacterized membrane protein
MGPHMYQPYYPIGLLLLIVVIGFLAVLIFFPSLERVKSEESIRHEVERRGEERPSGQKRDDEEAGSRGQALEIALRLLEPDEKRVVEAIVAAGGTMLQKDVSYELGFSRVKTHRVMVKLLRRGVVTAEKHHNTNRIELADWIKEG